MGCRCRHCRVAKSCRVSIQSNSDNGERFAARVFQSLFEKLNYKSISVSSRVALLSMVGDVFAHFVPEMSEVFDAKGRNIFRRL